LSKTKAIKILNKPIFEVVKVLWLYVSSKAILNKPIIESVCLKTYRKSNFQKRFYLRRWKRNHLIYFWYSGRWCSVKF
jgi:hypothetical protein